MHIVSVLFRTLLLGCSCLDSNLFTMALKELQLDGVVPDNGNGKSQPSGGGSPPVRRSVQSTPRSRSNSTISKQSDKYRINSNDSLGLSVGVGVVP